MKRLLSIFGAIGLIATSSSTVVACGEKNKDNDIKVDTSAWDAMKINDFEKLFETAILDIIPSNTEAHELNDGDGDTWWNLMEKLNFILCYQTSEDGDNSAWTAKNTSDFISLFNAYWTRDKYNLFNYAIDRFKNDDPNYNFLFGNDDRSSGLFDTLADYLWEFEIYISPVSSVTLTVGYSEWDRLINKMKIK